MRIELVDGDITAIKAEALVNAANSSLLGGGGVDGAIHRAAGPELLAECKTLAGCPTGEARITRGYRLSAAWVIHTVGPVWRGGKSGEALLLNQCYQNSLELASQHACRSVAFPAISTGAYGYPIDQAAGIAIEAIMSFLAAHDRPERVILVCFSPLVRRAYEQALSQYGLRHSSA